MSIKMPAEITKYTCTENTFCWHCNESVPAGTVFLTQIYRDYEGFYTDEDSCCGFCALHNDRVFAFTSDYNQRLLTRDLDQEALVSESEMIESYQKEKARKTQEQANARKTARKQANAAYTKALNKAWVDKINSAFRKVS